MKKVILFFSFVVMAALVTHVNAQVIDASNDRGCIADFNYQKADCYGCGQRMPDGSGFCQQPVGQDCPKCWTLEESHWDETLGTQIFTLTIDPDGTPTVKQVHSVTRVVESWGVSLHYIEI